MTSIWEKYIKRKDNQLQREDQLVTCVTRTVRKFRPISHVPDESVYTNKMKFALGEGRDAINVTKQAILLLFAVP